MQKRADESTVDLEELIPKPRTSKPSKPYSYNPAQRNTSPPGACTAHLSPCCQSPSMRPHPKSTPSTPCPVPSPAVTTPQSPTISPAASQMPKGADPQDKRGEGQPLQDYPESLEPGKRKHNHYNGNILLSKGVATHGAGATAAHMRATPRCGPAGGQRLLPPPSSGFWRWRTHVKK